MAEPRSLLDNFVVLLEGVPKRLHFTAWAVHDREMVDPLTRVTKRLSVLQLVVDREDGQPAATVLSITSSELADQLQPYLYSAAYQALEFVVTRRGSGFSARYSVAASPTL